MVTRTPWVIAAALVALALAPPSAAALRFERCGGYGFSCARLSVPLDRTGAVPGRISLLVERVRARRRPARGAVFVLAGGPGQSASFAYGADALGALFPAFRRRDLIVFDQRGTGRSGVLRCRALERSNLLDAGRDAGACARRLGVRRAYYTTSNSVEDIEAIRGALGLERITIFGTSYGTKVALAYALRYPANVNGLVLDSVVEAGGPDPLYLDTIAAVPRVLRALCRGSCRRFTRDPVADLGALVQRLAAGPLRGMVVNDRGRRRRAAITSGNLFAVLLGGDYDPSLRSAVPGAVRAALEGDPAPLLRLRRRALAVGEPPPARVVSVAVYAATTCEESSFPWPRTAPPDPAERRRQAAAAVATLPEASLFPFDRATVLESDVLALCERWPAAASAPALGPGPLPDVPVLLLEGEDDLRTPVESATRVAALFPRSTLVVAPATGHSALASDRTGCARRAFARFFAGLAVRSRCRRARREFRPSPPPPTALRRVPRARGVAGVRGRAITALALTLRDVRDDALTRLTLDLRRADLARGGGLRRGRYRLGGRSTLRLYGIVFVPGVRVSGRIRRFGGRRQRGRVRLGGAAAPRGLLTINGNRVRGRLGGRRVRARLRPPSGAAREAARAARFPRLSAP
jgi:pimeloyl-ACP methyl ester carboxylesterase